MESDERDIRTHFSCTQACPLCPYLEKPTALRRDVGSPPAINEMPGKSTWMLQNEYLALMKTFKWLREAKGYVDRHGNALPGHGKEVLIEVDDSGGIHERIVDEATIGGCGCPIEGMNPVQCAICGGWVCRERHSCLCRKCRRQICKSSTCSEEVQISMEESALFCLGDAPAARRAWRIRFTISVLLGWFIKPRTL